MQHKPVSRNRHQIVGRRSKFAMGLLALVCPYAASAEDVVSSWEYFDIVDVGNLDDLEWTGREFVAAGDGHPGIYVSKDGRSWQPAVPDDWDLITVVNGIEASSDRVVLAEGSDIYATYGPYVGTASGPNQWTKRYDAAYSVRDVIWTGQQFVAVSGGGSFGDILVSADGWEWTVSGEGPFPGVSLAAYGIGWNGSYYLIVGNNGFVSRSTNLATWEIIAQVDSDYLSDIVWTGDKWVATGKPSAACTTCPVVWTSTDGVGWLARFNRAEDDPTTRSLEKIVRSGAYLFAVGWDMIVVSKDGLNWTRETNPDGEFPLQTPAITTDGSRVYSLASQNGVIISNLLNPPGGVVYGPVAPPSYGDCTFGSETASNLIFMTHGWRSDEDAWAVGLKNEYVAQIGIDPNVDLNDWDICTYDWRDDANDGFAQADRAVLKAYLHGQKLGDEISQRVYEHVHLIGHSAGSTLIQSLAERLNANSPGSPPAIHLTFLDAYVPGWLADDTEQLSLLTRFGSGADFAEHYVDRRGVAEVTDRILPGAYNFDIGDLDLMETDWIGFRSHAWPTFWYPQTVAEIDDFGFWEYEVGKKLSLESGRAELPSHQRLSDGSTYYPLWPGNNVCVLERSVKPPDCGESSVSPYIGSWSLDPITAPSTIISAVSSTAGTATYPTDVIDTDSFSASLTTGPSSWFSYIIDTLEEANGLVFDYEFVGGSDGYFQVFVDGEPVVAIDQRISAAGKQTTPALAIGRLISGEHLLSFRLDSDDGAADTVEITQLALGTFVAGPILGRAVKSDLDGDGKSDILFRNSVTGANQLYVMNGATISQNVPVTTVPATWEAVGRGDYNGDGKSDILWRYTPTGALWIYLMDGNAVSSSLFVGTIADSNWQVAGNGDYNGDGKSDILWRHQTLGTVWLYTMDGNTVTNSTGVGVVPNSDWQIVGGGDYNGDGKSDILWRNSMTGTNWLYLMNRATVMTSAGVSVTSDLDWTIAGSGDYDGDGKSDILWRNVNSGANWMYLMDGTQIATSQSVSELPDLNWIVVGDGDYDGDGNSDVLWRNLATGSNWVYLMNGPTITDSGSVSTVTDQNWQIVNTN